jgi:hypothetical protein
MASSRFPFSHVPSEISFFPFWETKVTHLRWRLPTSDDTRKASHADMADPRVASCIRFDHRQAIHLLLLCSSTSQKDGLKASKATRRLGPVPFEQAFPRSRSLPLDMRSPGHPSRRPTREASEPGRSKPLFNPRHTVGTRYSDNVSLG